MHAHSVSDRLRDAWIVLRRAVAEAREDRLTTTAQALAFSLFLAVPAMFLVALGLFSLFAGEQALQELLDRAGTVMPNEAVVLLEDSLRRTGESTGGGIVITVVGFLLALWTTTSAAATLMESLTRTFDRPDSRGFVRTVSTGITSSCSEGPPWWKARSPPALKMPVAVGKTSSRSDA